MPEMKLFLLVTLVFCVSCSHTYYVVRHAEKESAAPNMSSDVPLSAEGKIRAQKLKEILAKKRISAVFSTNTIRTKSTGQPTADHFGLSIQEYGPRPDSAFIVKLKSMKKNVLIVGHSNTVDDIVNGLCGEKKVPGDLPDNEYNKLYEVRFKGKKINFTEASIYPYTIPPNPKF